VDKISNNINWSINILILIFKCRLILQKIYFLRILKINYNGYFTVLNHLTVLQRSNLNEWLISITTCEKRCVSIFNQGVTGVLPHKACSQVPQRITWPFQSNHYESVVYLSTICLFAPCYTISKPQSDWMPSLDKEDGVKVVVDKEDNYRSWL
jgi:hypothetical protein